MGCPKGANMLPKGVPRVSQKRSQSIKNLVWPLQGFLGGPGSPQGSFFDVFRAFRCFFGCRLAVFSILSSALFHSEIFHSQIFHSDEFYSTMFHSDIFHSDIFKVRSFTVRNFTVRCFTVRFVTVAFSQSDVSQ